MGLLPTAHDIFRNGYRFTGWFTDLSDETSRIRSRENLRDNVSLFARWAATPEGFQIGDTIGSGRVTSADATMIARHITGSNVDICLLAADLNGDGYVDVSDIILLARWLAGHNVSPLIAH